MLHQYNTLSHIFFNKKFSTKKNMTIVPHPPYFSLFHQLKIKLKDRHFYTIEVIKAESQAVLSTLTEHDFQDAFKRWQKHWEHSVCVEGVYIKGDAGQ
jgi:hypothetical protein